MKLFAQAASNNMQQLRQAACNRNFEELKRLSKLKGANVNEAGGISGMTALHWSAAVCDQQSVSYLLGARSAAVDPQDFSGNTPLSYAVDSDEVGKNAFFSLTLQSPKLPVPSLDSKLSVIYTLLREDADASIENVQDLSPLMKLLAIRERVGADQYYHYLYLPKEVVLAKIDEVVDAMKAGLREIYGQETIIRPNGKIVLPASSRAVDQKMGDDAAYVPGMEPAAALHTVRGYR